MNQTLTSITIDYLLDDQTWREITCPAGSNILALITHFCFTSLSHCTMQATLLKYEFYHVRPSLKLTWSPGEEDTDVVIKFARCKIRFFFFAQLRLPFLSMWGDWQEAEHDMKTLNSTSTAGLNQTKLKLHDYRDGFLFEKKNPNKYEWKIWSSEGSKTSPAIWSSALCVQ